MHIPILAFGMMILAAMPAVAIETPSLSLGQTLFESTELGNRGRSCNGCHPDGQGLEMIGDFNDQELKDIINACLRDAVGAEMISTESQEMDALLAYVRIFQKNRNPEKPAE